ncbi:hypothetical protein O6H91_07G033700 [Diphasiastrum complanatum]|uniref:Uncharacterized protein n=1 Tax=Diphasiastrum complanatum TaxID=34168 RepID=A0ACC2D3W4_DIPCM|nr:hypothetical protein O6H91_07G033700 [Diphasiastrum complanatum]
MIHSKMGESSPLELQPPPTHVVVFAFHAQGHIIPAFNFSKQLASKGLFISFVCAEHRMPGVRKIHESQGSSSNIRLAALPERVPAGKLGVDQGLESFEYLVDIAETMEHDFELLMLDLLATQQSCSSPGAPICIISDLFLGWTQYVADKLKLPRYVFYPSPAAALCVAMYLPNLIAQGLIPIKSSESTKERESDLISIPGIPPISPSDMPNALKESCPIRRRDFAMRNHLLLHKSSGILLNTFYELEQRSIEALQSDILNPNKVPIYPAGPILPEEIFGDNILHARPEIVVSGVEKECLLWLNTRLPSSVLYISFGSIAVLSASQIREFALGLENSEQAFLWVLRPPPATDPTQSSIAAILPEGFQSRTQGRGLILSVWAPQLLILSHPSTGGFLTHCGWNSTLESICNCVPMLPFPQFAEQQIICNMLVNELKVGVEVKKGADGLAKSSEIEKVVRYVMRSEEGGKMKARAGAMRKAAKTALLETGSSYKNLEAFLHRRSKTRAANGQDEKLAALDYEVYKRILQTLITTQQPK